MGAAGNTGGEALPIVGRSHAFGMTVTEPGKKDCF